MAKRMSRVHHPLPAPAGDAEHEPEAMDALDRRRFRGDVNDGPEDYVSVLKRTQARLKEAMFSAGKNPAGQPDRHQQAAARPDPRNRTARRQTPHKAMTTQEDPEDDDDDGEFRPEAI